MRWKEQSVEADGAGRLPGYRDSVVRTFDAPEALNVRFHEVRAKSALNRVPAASRVPFEWTVNPYRGCLHACSYCLSGDTPILLAGGRTRPLAELRVGEEIYGTEAIGRYRRYVRTTVLDKWSTVKPAFRVTLADGTRIVASGDHRFLTGRGWKHVTGEPGDARPFLTPGDTLSGAAGGEVIGRGAPVGARPELGVVSIEPLGIAMRLFDITTGTGDFIADGVVSHNCFARPTHEYLDFDAGRDFEREIVVKVNIPEVLRAELARPSWTGDHVALGTNTDPYQWVEKRYGLMRGIWEAFRDAANPCSILTKSPLLLRDADLLREIAQRTHVSACLSIPTMDERWWRATEPHTPHPRARLEAVKELNRLGIPTGVLVAPLMPGINDDPAAVERVIAACQEAGAASIGGQALFLAGSTRAVFMDWLRTARPDLVPEYERMYAGRSRLRPEERARIEAPLRRLRRTRNGPRFERPAQSAAEVATGLRREGPAMTPRERAVALTGQESLF